MSTDEKKPNPKPQTNTSKPKSAGIKSANASTRNKKIVTTSIVAGGILALMMLALWISDPKKGEPDALNQAKQNAEETKRNFNIDPSSTVESEQAWQNKSEDEIHLTKTKVGTVEDQVRSLQEELAAERQQNNEKLALMSQQMEELRNRPPVVQRVQERQARPQPIRPQQTSQASAAIPPRPTNNASGRPSLPPAPNINGLKGSALADEANRLNGLDGAGSPSPAIEEGIKHVSTSGSSTLKPSKGGNAGGINSSNDGTSSDIKKIRNVKSYIPAGSFGRVIMLSGVDAPTGGLAKSNPMPVLLRIKDKGTLANHFKSDLEECTVIGAAAGDIASERVNIRLESITCILADGNVIEKVIHGYVTGDDGKAGFRGRVVSKQGSILAKSALAGIAGGLGKATTQQYQNIQSSALGTVTSFDPNKAVEAGLSEGVGNAMQQIAEFYIARANETYPIIEISAGRIGELVLQKGVDFGVEHVGKKRKG